MVKNTLDDLVGKFWGEELNVIWHCKRKVHRSSGFVLSNISGAQAHVWLMVSAGVCASGAGGVGFCPSLSSAWMNCRIRSSEPVGPGGTDVVVGAGFMGGGKLVSSGGGWVVSTECTQQGIFDIWNWGSGMSANPSGEGFRTSGVPVSSLFSGSLNSPSSTSFVCRSCSSMHRGGMFGGLSAAALCSTLSGFP